MNLKKWSNGLLILGLLLVAAALCLTLYNRREEQRAGDDASRVLEMLEEMSEETSTADSEQSPEEADADPTQTPSEEAIPDYILDPEMEMPEKTVYNISYIGIIEIPALDRKLPVISEWSYPNLKAAPCRYEGSAYEDNLIIAAHNYTTHFGNIKYLSLGDGVTFTDMSGNVFRYRVVEMETLGGSAVEEMSAGNWDLTLFTCTIGGATRVTVRCEKIGETEWNLSSE